MTFMTLLRQRVGFKNIDSCVKLCVKKLHKDDICVKTLLFSEGTDAKETIRENGKGIFHPQV